MSRQPLPIPADHPAFAGHFPGQPITPGVVLLDQAVLVIEAAESVRIKGIAMAKFLSPTLPGEPLWLTTTRTAGAIRFEIGCGERKIATGRMVLA